MICFLVIKLQFILKMNKNNAIVVHEMDLNCYKRP